jgi:hypothetical protein
MCRNVVFCIEVEQEQDPTRVKMRRGYAIALIKWIFQVKALDVGNYTLPFERIQIARRAMNDR